MSHHCHSVSDEVCDGVGITCASGGIGGVVGAGIGGVTGLNLCYLWQCAQDSSLSYSATCWPGVSIFCKALGIGAAAGASVGAAGACATVSAIGCYRSALCLHDKCQQAGGDEANALLQNETEPGYAGRGKDS